MTETEVTIDRQSPAYQFMRQKLGESGMAMLDEQLTKWEELNSKELNSPLRDSLAQGNTQLPEGTLLHATNLDSLGSIAELGVVSGELMGVYEDAETHGCADFFRVPTDTTLEEYAAYCREPITLNGGTMRTSRGERMLFGAGRVSVIVDPQATGMDELLQHDGYRDEALQGFVQPPETRNAETTAAILGGVPRGAIAGLIVSGKTADSAERMVHLKELFPQTPILTV